MMRAPVPALFLAILLVVSLPAGLAETPAKEAPTSTATDNPGDVTFDATATSQDAPDAYDFVDLLSASIGMETLETLTATIELSTLDTPAGSDSLGGAPDYALYFSFGGLQYRVATHDFGRVGAESVLESYNEALNEYRPVVPLTPNVDGTRLSYQIPKEAILDANHTMPAVGARLTGLFAFAQVAAVRNPVQVDLGVVATPAAFITAIDRAPDNGFGQDYPIQSAKSESVGHLMLSSPNPLRVSNGGAATNIVFKVVVANAGDADDVALLHATDVPSDWSVRFAPRVPVAARSRAEFPVIATTDSGHKHGETTTFTIHAVSRRDANANASLHLGVYWTDVPQPAGHHHELFLHSRDDGAAWFNPQRDDAASGATDVPVVMQTLNMGDGKYEGVWRLPLSPHLILGLDLRAPRDGTAHLEFVQASTAQAAQVFATIDYCDPDNQTQEPWGGGSSSFNFGGGSYPCAGRWIPLLRGSSTEEAWTMGSEPTVEFVFRPTGESLYRAYKPGANLGLTVRAVTDLPQGVPFRFGGPSSALELDVKDSRVSLPLLEYSDPVELGYKQNPALELKATTPIDKEANPGRTAVYKFRLTNHGTTDRRLAIDLDGYHKEWARLASSDLLRLPAASHTDLVVGVQVPDGTKTGETAELLLMVSDAIDPASLTFANMRLRIVEGTSVADESGMLSGVDGAGGRAPGLEPLGILVAVCAALLLARRWAA